MNTKISAIFIAAALMLLTACGGNQNSITAKVPMSDNLPEDVAKKWTEIVQAANKEGELNLIAHSDIQYQAIAESFQEVFPNIKVKLTSMMPQEYAPRIVAEQKNGQFLFDVVFGTVSNVTSIMIPANTLIELPPHLILPEVTDDSKWNGGFAMYSTEKPYAFIYQRSIGGSVYVNRDFISKDQVNSIRDFLKPELKGKMVNYDMNKLAGGTAALAAYAKREGKDFVKQLYKQDIVNGTDQRQIVKWLVEGKYPIALFAFAPELKMFQDQGIGKNVEIIDDSFLVDAGVGVMKNAAHPNAATVFVNWLLSKQGQEAVLKASPINNTRRSDLPVQDKDREPNYNEMEKYVNMSDPNHQGVIKKAIQLYQEHNNKK